MKSSLRFIFYSYIKSRLKVLIAFVLFIIIFTIVYALYRLPMEPIVYSIELVVALGFIFVSIDSVRFYQKHQILSGSITSISSSVNELPNSKDLLENDYKNLIKGLVENRGDLIFQFDNKQTEMIDYYTLWAHQIKTPISAMGLLLQTEDKASEQTKAYQQELFKIEQYVEMVLQYLRLESMTSDLIIKEYDLLSSVKQAVKKYSMIFIN